MGLSLKRGKTIKIDMSESMLEDALSVIEDAFEKWELEEGDAIANYISETFDGKYGEKWTCWIFKGGLGCSMDHDGGGTSTYLHQIYNDDIHVILFKD